MSIFVFLTYLAVGIVFSLPVIRLGEEGKSFYQRQAKEQIPDWVSGFAARELRDFCALTDDAREQRLRGVRETHQGIGFLIHQGEARAELLRQQISVSYNPNWGALFREDSQLSRFGRQVREFACIYTSSVANFLNYPGNHFFTASEERLPHE